MKASNSGEDDAGEDITVAITKLESTKLLSQNLDPITCS
jgi:hypothetical protein